MIHGQDVVSRIMQVPVSALSNATITGIALDTLGYDHAIIDVMLDTAADGTNNPANCTLCESADTNAGTAIAAFTGDGASGFTVPTQSLTGSSGSIIRFSVALVGRKRYLSVQLTSSTVGAELLAVHASLSRGGHAHTTTGPTDVQLGCTEIVYG